MRALFEALAPFIAEWNLEDDDDQPLPITVDTLLDLEDDFALAIVTAWLEKVMGISAPLDSGSTPGPQPPPTEVSLPMETLQPSLAS